MTCRKKGFSICVYINRANRGSCPGCVCCQTCGTKGFQKLVEVKDLGLVIYRYSDNQSKDNEDKTKEIDPSEDVFIVHNKNDMELKKDSMKKAIDQYLPSCPRCRKIVEHVNNLIDNVQRIDENKIIGICEICKMRDVALKKHCDCEKILNKFMTTKQEEKPKLTSQMKEWISKIQDKYTNITYDHDKQRIRLNIEKEQVHHIKDTKLPGIEEQVHRLKDTKLLGIEEQVHRLKDTKLPGIKEVREHETHPRIEEFRFTDYPKQSLKETKVKKAVRQGKVTYVSDDELPQYRRSQQYDHELEIDDLRFNRSSPDRDFAVSNSEFNAVEHSYELKSEKQIKYGTKSEKKGTWQRAAIDKSSDDKIDLVIHSDKAGDHTHKDDKYVDRDEHRGHLVESSHIKELSPKIKGGVDQKQRRLEHTKILYSSDDDLVQMEKSKHHTSPTISKEHLGRSIRHKIKHEDISQSEELLKYVKTIDKRKDVSPVSDKLRSLGAHEAKEKHKEEYDGNILPHKRKHPVSDKLLSLGDHEVKEKHKEEYDENILRHKRKHSDEHLPRTISTLPKHHLPSEMGFKYFFPKKKKIAEATIDISSTELVRETREKILKKTLEEKEKKKQIQEKRQAERAKKLKEQEEKLLIKKKKEEEEEAKKQKELEEKLKLQKLKEDADEKKRQKKLKEQGDMTSDKKSERSKKGDEGDQKGTSKGKSDKQPREVGASSGADGTSSKGSKPKTDVKQKIGTKEDDIVKSKVDKTKEDTTKSEDKKSKDQYDKSKDEVSTKDKQTLKETGKAKDEKESRDKQKDTKTKDDVTGKEEGKDKTKDIAGGKDKGKDDTDVKDKAKDDAGSKEKAKDDAGSKDKAKDDAGSKDKAKDDAGSKDKAKDDAGKKKPTEDVSAKDKAKEKAKKDASDLANEKLKQMLAQQAKMKEENERKARELAEKKAKEAADAVQKEKDELEKEKVPETEEEKARREKAQKNQIARNLDVKHIKVRQLSNDDNILNLVKMKQKPTCFDDLNVTNFQVAHHCAHRNVLKDNCALCKDSDLELDVESVVRRVDKNNYDDIIIGNKIFKCKKPYKSKKEKDTEFQPMLFKVASLGTVTTFEEPEPEVSKQTGKKDGKAVSAKESKSAAAKDAKSVQLKTGNQPEPETGKGVIKYSLSDRAYIEKGWTMLPTEKVVRKMNVYRMRPAHPEFDWFEHNKKKGIMKYDTGERLADFNDQGRGRWYYRNGGVALDYYDAEEINAQQRFVIYSSGLPDEGGHYCPVSVLASFDYLGNGVVFDNTGKIRLKYNQTEGVILDRSLGPVSHWKWHTLNDPPVLQQVMIDTYLPHKDPGISNLGGPPLEKFNPDNEEMLAIEFDNFVKEKSKKLTQKFKPFQIKMKALKINDNFSLKVLDQANVHLIYRDGSTSLKLNLGMILNHQEIIDTDTAEVGEVSNSLERLPARTDSLAGLQQSVVHAQRLERIRTERERRIRRPQPSSSVDKLKMGISKPISTHMIIPCPSCNAAAVSHMPCRKPCGSNVYYNTGFI